MSARVVSLFRDSGCRTPHAGTGNVGWQVGLERASPRPPPQLIHRLWFKGLRHGAQVASGRGQASGKHRCSSAGPPAAVYGHSLPDAIPAGARDGGLLERLWCRAGSAGPRDIWAGLHGRFVRPRQFHPGYRQR
eukprot:scaffold18901_cov121-Isochrysis_galbana.AAC.2